MEKLAGKKEIEGGDALGEIFDSLDDAEDPSYDLATIRRCQFCLFVYSDNARRKGSGMASFVHGRLLRDVLFISPLSVHFNSLLFSASCDTPSPPSRYPLAVSIYIVTLRFHCGNVLQGWIYGWASMKRVHFLRVCGG